MWLCVTIDTIYTGISNGQKFQLHLHYGLNFQRVRAQRAKSRARQIAWFDKSRMWIGLLQREGRKIVSTTKDSKHEKTNVKSKIFFKHSYSHRTAFLLEDKLKTRSARVYLLSEEVQKVPYRRAERSSALALHCVRSRIENALFSRGHVRTNMLSAKNGPKHS